jgi:hypothetical protein
LMATTTMEMHLLQVQRLSSLGGLRNLWSCSTPTICFIMECFGLNEVTIRYQKFYLWLNVRLVQFRGQGKTFPFFSISSPTSLLRVHWGWVARTYPSFSGSFMLSPLQSLLPFCFLFRTLASTFQVENISANELLPANIDHLPLYTCHSLLY